MQHAREAAGARRLNPTNRDDTYRDGGHGERRNRGMIRIDADLNEQSLKSRMLLQVHDELVFEVAAGELEAVTAIVRGRMAGAAQLRVPLDVQIGTGPNWDAAAH